MRIRERYAMFGPEGFNDEELLALIIGLGAAGQSPQQLAVNLLQRHGTLSQLCTAPVSSLEQTPGIGPARAVRLHAALHAGQRAARSNRREPATIRTPEDAWHMVRPNLEALEHEELHALYLSRRNVVIALRPLTRGSDQATIMDPRQVFRPAVQCGAAGVIIAHNHPSGDPTPSCTDISATQRLAAAGRVLGVALLDHLILGSGRFVSMGRAGEIPAGLD